MLVTWSGERDKHFFTGVGVGDVSQLVPSYLMVLRGKGKKEYVYSSMPNSSSFFSSFF